MQLPPKHQAAVAEEGESDMLEIIVTRATPREIQERGEKAKEALKGKNPFSSFETQEKIMEWYRRLTYQPGQPIYIPFGDVERKAENERNNNPMVIPVLRARQEPLNVNPRRSADEAKQPIGCFNKPSE